MLACWDHHTMLHAVPPYHASMLGHHTMLARSVEHAVLPGEHITAAELLTTLHTPLWALSCEFEHWVIFNSAGCPVAQESSLSSDGSMP